MHIGQCLLTYRGGGMGELHCRVKYTYYKCTLYCNEDFSSRLHCQRKSALSERKYCKVLEVLNIEV